MIRLCTGEVYTLDSNGYKDEDLLAWFLDGHENALIQLVDSNGVHAGIITLSTDSTSNTKSLEKCSYCIPLNRGLFDNAKIFFEKTGLEYCPIVNASGQLEAFCYNDTHNAWNELEKYVAQINEMKHPEGIFEGYESLNLWGLNEVGFQLAQIFENNSGIKLCCIGEYWEHLGFPSAKMGDANGYDVLLEGNYGLPVDEMGYWKHDAVAPSVFEDLITRMKDKIHSKHAYGDRFCSIHEGRALLRDKIISGQPFCATRLGHTEGWITMKYINQLDYDDNALWWLYHTSGFFSASDYSIEDVNLYAKKTTEALANTDILFSQFDDSMCAINHCLPEASPIFPFEGLWHDNPTSDDDVSWISALAGKRVLVISPFVETVKMQYEKRELLFHGNQILPEFELIPFQMISTQNGNKCGFRDFFEAYETILRKVASIDFDIALIGAGAYGFLLASDIKNMGKQSVELCSYLMPLFGIKIKRNLTEPHINKFYNSNWSFPIEKPVTNYRQIENGCYWR